jgi:putative ATP-dependent endonuclease of OLD family
MAKVPENAKGPNKKEALDETIELGKVRTLSIRNFRAVGSSPVVVDIDNIVVLVGPNNAGKSSILRAYEVVMAEGGKAGQLTIDDFPNGEIDPDNLPEIVLETEVAGDPPAKKWLINADGKRLVRERWRFDKPGPGTRQGWNPSLGEGGDWDTSKPWGFANVANARRPQPHAVKAFDSPEEQAKQISDIVLTLVKDRAKAIPSEDGEGTEFAALSERLRAFQAKVLDQTKEDIEGIEAKLTEMLAGVFAEHVVKFDPAVAQLDELKLFTDGQMRVGPKDGYKSPLEMQGSGARRCLLWSVLRIISESDKKNVGRPHLLLIDEPELCLHPRAVREACAVLYDLADKAGWQVMITTHHPAFIDLARDNKTIVRVERDVAGDVSGTTLFRPSTAKLSDNDKKNLKLLNIYDPYVAEFFFGGNVVLVEGDTEYSVFKLVASELLESGDASPISAMLLRDLMVVRARGKATLVSLAKILNHFGSRYSILHDADTETITVKDKKTGQEKVQKNPAWTVNRSIVQEADLAPDPAPFAVAGELGDGDGAAREGALNDADDPLPPRMPLPPPRAGDDD